MLREHAKSVDRAIATVDVGIIILSLVAADGLVGRYGAARLFHAFGGYVAASCLVWYLVLAHADFYRSLRTSDTAGLLRKVLQTAIVAEVVNAAVLFAVAPRFSRRVFVAHFVVATLLLSAWKLALRALWRCSGPWGAGVRRVLVVGTREPAVRFMRHVEEHREGEVEIIGCLQGIHGPSRDECAGYPVLGRLDRLLELCTSEPVDEIVFTLPARYLDDLAEILPRIEALGIAFRMAVDCYRPLRSRILVGSLGDDDPIPLVTYYRMSLDPLQLFLKRILDVVGSAVGLVLAGVVLPVIALAIRLDSRGPVFFRQQRVGQNGRTFTCLKFRTMYVDAEERKKELLSQNEMSGAIFKIKDDPRITRVGAFLRRTSLDELPQFWNVFRGEMSLVGTRPPTPDEVEKYEEWHRGRICIKPGLTGMWQTSGRNQVSDFDEVCALDMHYIDNWSLWLDLKLLCKTVGVVALGVGAR